MDLILNAQIAETLLSAQNNKLTYSLALVLNLPNEQQLTRGVINNEFAAIEDYANFLSVLSCGSWENLKNSFVRVKIRAKAEKENAEIIGLGNIITDQWIQLADEDPTQEEKETIEIVTAPNKEEANE